jgi:pimeloyl-ACP methyl ester carboxylesterase
VSPIDNWARRGRTIDTDQGAVFVVDEPGPEVDPAPDPFLVLHGFPTCSLDWAPVLPALAAARRVCLPDFVGFGLSAKPDRAYSLFAQADVIESVARELGLTSVVLVTHDMGDSVGGELLARALDGTLGFSVSSRVVTNGSIYLELAHLTDGQKLLESLPDAALPADAAPTTEALRAALRATLAPASPVPDAELDVLADLVVRDGGNTLLPRTIRYLSERREHEPRWTGAIERHPAPLTIVWGDLDPIAVWPMAERLRAARPDATLVRLEGVGHYPMLEAPDAFVNAFGRGDAVLR